MKLYDPKQIVIATGGFDPLHSGHLDYLNAAKQLGDFLVVGLNSDDWLTRKKGKPFLPYSERKHVLHNLKAVDRVIDFDDTDDNAADAILKTRHQHPEAEIIFANGGDRTSINIPELELFKDTLIRFEFNVGGSKRNSSSNILQQWADLRKFWRPWGYYTVLHTDGYIRGDDQTDTLKVKELVVQPGKSLSMQRHKYRAEHWFITSGTATVYTINEGHQARLLGEYEVYNKLHIDRNQWHQLANEYKEPLRIVEIQYGESCSEDDIQRKSEKDST